MESKTQISIIGCGWLGFSLAKSLLSDGYDIKGSTTSKDKMLDLKKHKIQPYRITLSETQLYGDMASFLKDSAVAVINIPPGLRRNPNKNHVAELELLIRAIEQSQIKKVLYVSSTSVYPNTERLPVMTENSEEEPDSENGRQLLQIEKKLLSNTHFKTTILRFGGLFGADRHPAKYLSGRQHIKNPKAPVNLIHKEDCIGIISKIIEKGEWGFILNAVSPNHPEKKAYYTTYCKTHGLPLPQFDENRVSKGKKISSEKMAQLLNYSFKHGL